MTTDNEQNMPEISPEQVEQALESFRLGSPAEFDRLINGGAAEASGVCAALADIIDLSAARPELPERIGDYAIIREIGRGGMAVVYEAKQESTGRSVALKVVSRLAPAGERGIRLFRREVDTLARLKHPHIATLYDAGQTREGHSFFAMELVGGRTLAAYLERKTDDGGAPIVDRRSLLDLFQKICRAMAYAHQRGVIHCDLKPTNIFVDAEGNPKILDFGLARLLDAERTYLTSILDAGRIVGTLQYMSPEQAGGDADNIDIRSDVYALGVILYQMLTGSRPYEARCSALPDAIRNIRELPPRRPSAVNAGLRGDLETIILKALEKAPEQRYQSVNAFADDIERFLANQPILARQPNAIYQLQKVIARHKMSAALAAALCLVVIAAAILLGIQTARVSRERDNARAEARRAEQLNLYLQRMLPSFDPRTVGPSVMVREVLDKAGAGIDVELAGEPEIRATLHNTIGRSYLSLRQLDQAEQHLRAAMELWRSLRGELNPEYARSLHYLGLTMELIGKGEESEQMFRKAHEIRRQLFGDEHLDIAESLHDWALHLKRRGDFKEAEPIFHRALDMRRRLLGEHPDVAECLQSLGRMLVELARYDEAEVYINQAMDMQRRLLGAESYDAAVTLTDLGEIYVARTENAKAEQTYREQIRILEMLFQGEPNHFEANALGDLAVVLEKQGKFSEAETQYRQSVAMQRLLVGEDSVQLALQYNNYACFLRDQGRYKEAEPFARDVYQWWAIGEYETTSAAKAYAAQNLGSILIELGETDEAYGLLADAIEIWEQICDGRNNPRLINALKGQARLYELQGDNDESEKAYLEIVEIGKAKLGEQHAITAVGMIDLAGARNELGMPGAEEMCAEAVATLRKIWGDRHAEVSWGLSRLATIKLATGDLDGAEQAFRESIDIERGLEREKHPVLADSMRGLAEVLLARRDAANAESLLREALAIQEERYVEDDLRVAITKSALGECLAATAQYYNAEKALLSAHSVLDSQLGPEHPQSRLVRQRLNVLYMNWGRLGLAAIWQDEP